MSHEDSQMMKILETIADRLIDMHLSNNRRFDELAAQIESRLPAKVGEQLSLLAIVTAPEAVVPNEDEAMPVVDAQPPLVADPNWKPLASCPSCPIKAYTEAGIQEMFGYRTPAGRNTIRQSWCRWCRTDGKDKPEPVVESVVEPVIVQDEPAPRKCMPLPTDIADVGREARKLKKEAAALAKKAAAASPKHQPDLLRQAASKAEESTKKQSQYNQERGQFRPRPPKPGKGNK